MNTAKLHSKHGERLYGVVLLAFAYVLAGALGLQLATPPGFATIIWPPSGIALGALLIWGQRLAPGILIGAFLINAYNAGLPALPLELLLRETAVALVNAAAAMAQAMLACALAHRYFGSPLALRGPGQLLGLLLLCGPLASLIAASTGTVTLTATGRLTPGDLGTHWMTWWLGDTLGVLLFLPLTLIGSYARDRTRWRGKPVANLPLLATLPVLTCLGLTLYAWKFTYLAEYDQAQARFAALAAESERALRNRLASYNQALTAATAYLYGNPDHNAERWRSYVATLDLPGNLPGINGIGVIEPVAQENLSPFLHRMRAEHGASFTVRPPPGEDPAFVVSQVEPVDLNGAALGLNIAYEANRAAAAERSRDSGQPAITRKIDLVWDSQSTAGFLLLHPTYRDGRIPASVEERRQRHTGWVYAPFVGENFLSELTRSQGSTLGLRVYDGRSADPAQLIYTSEGMEDRGRGGAFSVSATLPVLQQQWHIVWESLPAFEINHSQRAATLVLIGGIVLTALLALFLITLSVREKKTLEWMSGGQLLLPAGIFLLSLAAAYQLYTTLAERENNFARIVVAEEAAALRNLISVHSSYQMAGLRRMAGRWQRMEGSPREAWRRDAAGYLRPGGALQTVQWIDENYRIAWSEPLAGNEAAIGMNVRSDRGISDAIDAAIASNTVTFTPPRDLVQGYNGLFALLPLRRGETFTGLLSAVFSTREFFATALERSVPRGLKIALEYAGETEFEVAADSDDLLESLATTVPFTLYDQPWQLRVIPSEAYVAGQFSALPGIILVAGVLFGVLLAATLRATLLARVQSRSLAESNELNAAILDSAANLIIATDAEGNVVSFNGAAEEALGYWAEHVIGRETPALWHDPAEVAARAAELSELTGREIKPGFEVFNVIPKREGVEAREWTFIRRDGSRFPVNQSVTLLRGGSDEITGYLAVIEDITERRQQEQALRNSEETFRFAMQYAPIGMALNDLQGRWLRVNPALCELFGLSEEELTATDFQALTHPDDLDQDFDVMGRMMAGEADACQFEKRFFHKSGRTIWCQLSGALIRDTDGDPRYFVTQIQDVTEQREMDRMKSEFISVISHELRTPLTSINGALGLLRGTAAESLPDSARKLLDIADRNCRQLVVLINDTLDMDKIASGQMRLESRAQALAPLLEDAVKANVAYAGSFGVELHLEPVAGDIRVDVDSNRLTQVLSNLLSNAAKFSEPGDTVNIAVVTAGNRVRITVSDEGCGIPEEFRTRIFGRFEQADSSATRAKGGTGLGLHISKQLVELMHGQIGFASEVGVGTEFWVEFPLADERALADA